MTSSMHLPVGSLPNASTTAVPNQAVAEARAVFHVDHHQMRQHRDQIGRLDIAPRRHRARATLLLPVGVDPVQPGIGIVERDGLAHISYRLGPAVYNQTALMGITLFAGP